MREKKGIFKLGRIYKISDVAIFITSFRNEPKYQNVYCRN